VRETSARMLALLGLLQSRVDWSGAELADRLGVTDRTVRKDVTRLRALGYPVDAVRGPGGHYRLGVGAKLPPLLLDEDEAVAVVVGLRAATGMAGFEETGARALAKLEHVLPDRLRRRLTALRLATSAGPVNTDSNVEDPAVEADLLTEIAAAIRDHQGLRCDYRDQWCEIEPYHLVAWQRRWYLVARDPSTGEWAPYRVDWLRPRRPGGRRFTPAPFPGELTEFVVREVARTGWAVHARIHVHAPAEEVMARINPAVGTVEAMTDTESILVTGGDSLEVVAVWIGMLGLDFSVTSPPALVDHLRVLARRYSKAIGEEVSTTTGVSAC
jgi:predicted DNA-binding transcriptional regulator YafY